MKTTIFKVLSLLLMIGLFTVSSCKKPDPDEQSAEDDARGSYIMADAFALGNNEAGGGDGGKSIPDCMKVERNIEMKTVKITFTDCNFRGAIRNGIINVSYSITDFGTRAVSLIITFDNYTFDNIGVEGTITTTFVGPYLKPVIKVVAKNMVATFNDNRTITWSSNKTFTFISDGFGDGDISTNVIEISGTATGINREGLSYTSTYNAVTVDRGCEYGYPVSGTVTIESDNGTSVIDYGDGTCDNKITVTIEGISVPITLN